MALRYTTNAYFEQVKHRYINKIDLFILAWEQEKPNRLCSQYSGWDLSKSFVIIWDGTGNPKKFSDCLLTGIQGIPVGKYTGTGIPAHACPWKILDF